MGEREVAIRRAAISLFHEHGFAAVGIRQIAAELSMSSSTLYHYCDSKLRLLEQIMIDSSEILEAATERALTRAEDPRLRFAHLAMTLAAIQIGSRRTCYVLDNEMRSISQETPGGRYVVEQRNRYEAHWTEAIEAGVAEGVFSCPNTDVARVGLIGMYSQTSLWYRPNQVLDGVDLCRDLVDLGLAGLGSPRLSDAEAKQVVDAAEFIRFAWEPAVEEPPSTAFPHYADLMSAADLASTS